MRLRDDAWRSNRTPLVLTQVDPRNKPSMDLFSRFGFVDEEPDPNDPEYHLLSLEFTGTNYVMGDQRAFLLLFIAIYLSRSSVTFSTWLSILD